MMWSGLRIYWAHDVYAIGIGSWQWFAFFPDSVYETLQLDRKLAKGIAFHFAFGWLFVINGAIYVTYLAVTGEWRHIVPDRHSPREARDVVLHDVKIKKQAPPQGKYNAAQRISYTVVLVMALIIVVSGFAIYKPAQLYPLAAAVRWLSGCPIHPLLDDRRTVPLLRRPRPAGDPIGMGQLPLDGHRLPDRAQADVMTGRTDRRSRAAAARPGRIRSDDPRRRLPSAFATIVHHRRRRCHRSDRRVPMAPEPTGRGRHPRTAAQHPGVQRNGVDQCVPGTIRTGVRRLEGHPDPGQRSDRDP